MRTPPPAAPTPPPTPAAGTPLDPPDYAPAVPSPPAAVQQRPQQPPPPPPKPKPPVPRKPQTKRVSFIQEPHDEYEGDPPIDTNPITQSLLHDVHEIEKEGPTAIATNDACQKINSSLLIERSPKTELEVSRPVARATPIHPDDIIIPPPPLFDTNVSESLSASEDEKDISLPPITVILERIVLPTPDVAETSMQSSNSTNSPEAEAPPPVNYSAFPTAVSHPISVPFRSTLQSDVPLYQVFRTSEPLSFNSDDYYNELSVSPGDDLEPPELLHVHYGILPSVSHIPHSPCNLHPDQTFSDDIPTHIPTHYSLRDLRVRNIPPSMVHSSTYPPINPYPSLTTVAGTYNPYTCTVPVNASSQSCNCYKPQVSPSLPSPLVQDINANVTRTTPTNIDERPKSVQSERRVRFGEVTTAPEPDLLFKSSEFEREASALPTSSPKPAWSSKIKSFAIGEVISVRHSYPHTLGLF